MKIQYTKTNTNKASITPPPQLKSASSKAFTLAETLTTLMVIGIVAALTIPSMMQHFREETLNKQKLVFSKKFEEGLKLMRVDDKLNTQYSSTEEFVEEMKKYFKIAQVCNNDNLENCFGKTFQAKAVYKEEVSAEKYFLISNLKTATNLSSSLDYDSNIIGLRLSDGNSILLTYNPTCIGIEPGNTTGNHYSCIGYVADINGIKAPNEVGKDIISNISLIKNFGLNFSIVEDKTVNKGTFTPVNNAANGFPTDYWLGAEKYCEEQGGSLPTKSQLNEMAEMIYADSDCSYINPNYKGAPYYSGCNSAKVQSHPLWAFVSQARGFWAAEEGYFRAFSTTGSDYNNDANWRRYDWDGGSVFCVK